MPRLPLAAMLWPLPMSLTKRPVDWTTVLDIDMVSGGGNDLWIRPAEEKL